MSDDGRQTAFDPAAPADERYDAQAELQRVYAPLKSALLPADAVAPIIDQINAGLEEEAMLKAARGARIIPFPGAPQRGANGLKGGPKSVWLDGLQIFAHGEYFEKPSPMGFEGLRLMVEQTPLLNSIIMTRIRQISRFTQPSEDGGPGFEIRHAERKHKIQGKEQESANLMAKFFQNCGWEFNPRRRKAMRRDNFTAFMAKLVRDTLSFDACPIETEQRRDKSLGIAGLYAIDGTTVRLCTEEGYDGNDKIFALQVIQGRVMTAYTLDDLVYEVRNPRSDVRLAGYGLGETELLIRIVTGFLNALTFNIKGFDENSIPRGLLHLSGAYSKEDLAAFKRYWNATVRGINNAWTLPVMVSPDQESKASFERFGVEFNEMYFAKWMTFLTSIACSIYGMDPAEINFESFAAQKSSLSGDDTEEKLAEAKDKGLRPLMGFFEALFTDFIVLDFAEKYCFRWVGLDDDDEKLAFEKQKLVCKVDELRAEAGYGPWGDGGIGDAPINPALIGPWQQLNMQQQGGDFGGQQGDFGQPGEGGAPQQGGQDASGEQPEDNSAPAPGAPQPAPMGGGQDKAAGEFGKSLIYSVGE